MTKYMAYEVTQTFSAFGVDFKGGELHDANATVNWPVGTTEKRIENGFLKLAAIEVGSDDDARCIKHDPAAEDDIQHLTPSTDEKKLSPEEEELLKQMEEDEKAGNGTPAAEGGN